MRLATLLPVLALLATACPRADDPSQRQTRIQSIGGLADDPVREVVYVTDAPRGLVYELDLATARVLRTTSLGNPVAGLATDPCGNTLYVCQTRFPLVTLLDLDRFQAVDHLALPASPKRIVADGSFLFLTSDAGLLEVRLWNRNIRVLATDMKAETRLALSAAAQALFTADANPSGLRVRRFDATGGGERQLEVLFPMATPVSLQVSLDGSRLFLGLAESGDLLVLDTQDLSVDQTVDFGPSLATVALNATSTRAYAVGAGLAVDERNTRDFQEGVGGVLAAGLTDSSGLFLANDGQSLITQQGDLLVRQGLFDVELSGAPSATLGQTWELRVNGPPGARAVVFWALDPGFLYLDPPGSAQARFLDLDPTTLRVLASLTLNRRGEAVRQYQVPAGSVPVTAVFLQAVSLDGTLLDVSNPRPVRLRDSFPCRPSGRFPLGR